MSSDNVDFSTQFSDRLEEITYLTSDTTSPTLSFECLLDAFLAVYKDCKGLSSQNEHITNFLEKYDKLLAKVQSLRVNTHDFDIVQTLATGAVGKVCLVREKNNKKVYAMKILKKIDLLSRREAAFFMEERNALVFAQSSPWITTLYSAFQDDDHLYLVMEYASGGSLRAYMNNREENMPESEAKFYTGEILVALDELHKLNFIHRDVKPENCLIDSTGHLKLADFGSCMRVGDEKRITSGETVGTPDYISPEILRANEGNVSYGQGCDWWSLGIILYELLFDEVPFYSESLTETYGKIMDHEKFFAFPDDCEASTDALDLMKRLICKQEIRIGANGADEIRQHVWFKEFDWEATFSRGTTPPFLPELSGPDDTRYFEDEEDESKKITQKVVKKNKDFSGNSLPFIGYTYLQNAKPIVTLQRGGASSLSTSVDCSVATSGVDMKRIMDLEAELLKAKSVPAFAAELTIKQSDLDTVNANLEKEVKTRKNLEDKVAAFEKEKNSIESTLKRHKLDRDHDAHERGELEERINQLKMSLDKEVKANLEYVDIQEIKNRMDRQILSLREEILTERALSERSARESAGLVKSTIKLEAEIMASRTKSKEAESALEESKMSITQLERKVAHEAQRMLDSETEKTVAMAREFDIQLMLTQSSAKIVEVTEKLERADHIVSNMTRENFALNEKFDGAMKKVQDLEMENEMEKTHQRSESGALESVKMGMKSDYENSVANYTAQHQREVADLSAKLSAEQYTSKDLKRKILTHDQSIIELDRSVRSLTQTNQSLTTEISHHSDDFDKIQQSLRDARSNAISLGEKCGALERENFNIQKDTSENLLRFHTENLVVAELRVRIKELGANLDEERKSKISAESIIRALETEKQNTQSELTRLQNRMSNIKEEQSSSLKDQQDQISRLSALESEIRNLQAESATANQVVKASAEEIIKLKKDVFKESAKAGKIAKSLKASEANNAELTHQTEKLSNTILDNESEIAKRQGRTTELELLISDLKLAAEESSKRVTMSMDNIKVENSASKGSLGSLLKDDKKRSFKGLKLKTALFTKGSSQHEKDERSKAMQKIQDTEDELRASASADLLSGDANSAPSAHLRKFSSASSYSQYGASLRSARPVSQISYDLSEGLKGWLKVPKGGKIKKGWKKVYAVVREYKIFIYDKEKDADDATIKPVEVYDLKSSIIYVKAVTQAELIHANARDIDSIFKIHLCNVKRKMDSILPSNGQSLGSDDTVALVESADNTPVAVSSSINRASSTIMPVTLSATSTTAVTNPNDTNKRINQLKAYIAIEEKFALGAQAILKASTTENQRQTTKAQLESFNKNIEDWKTELDKLVSEVHKSQPQDEHASDTAQSSGLVTSDYDQDLSDWKRDLEESLRKKVAERDAIQKLTKTQSVGVNILNQMKTKTSSFKEVDGALSTLDKDITRLKDDLGVLKAGNRKLIEPVLKYLSEKPAQLECNGHNFRKRDLTKPSDCGQCREAMWSATDYVKTVMECEMCHAMCHSFCKANFDITCQDYSKLKNIAPSYFMAIDMPDKLRWLAGIAMYIKDAANNAFSPTFPMANVASTIEEEQLDITHLMQLPMKFSASSAILFQQQSSQQQLDSATPLRKSTFIDVTTGSITKGAVGGGKDSKKESAAAI